MHTIEEIVCYLQTVNVVDWMLRENDFEFLMADGKTKSSKLFFRDMLMEIQSRRPDRRPLREVKVIGRFVSGEYERRRVTLTSGPRPLTQEQKHLIEELNVKQLRAMAFHEDILVLHNLARFDKVKILPFDKIKSQKGADFQRRKRVAISECYKAGSQRKNKRVSRTDAQEAVKVHMPELVGEKRKKMIDNVRISAQHRLTDRK